MPQTVEPGAALSGILYSHVPQPQVPHLPMCPQFCVTGGHNPSSNVSFFSSVHLNYCLTAGESVSLPWLLMLGKPPRHSLVPGARQDHAYCLSFSAEQTSSPMRIVSDQGGALPYCPQGKSWSEWSSRNLASSFPNNLFYFIFQEEKRWLSYPFLGIRLHPFAGLF